VESGGRATVGRRMLACGESGCLGGLARLEPNPAGAIRAVSARHLAREAALTKDITGGLLPRRCISSATMNLVV
jgi:hypothetical protein